MNVAPSFPIDTARVALVPTSGAGESTSVWSQILDDVCNDLHDGNLLGVPTFGILSNDLSLTWAASQLLLRLVGSSQSFDDEITPQMPPKEGTVLAVDSKIENAN